MSSWSRDDLVGAAIAYSFDGDTTDGTDVVGPGTTQLYSHKVVFKY